MFLSLSLSPPFAPMVRSETIFIDTDLDTHLAIIISNEDTVLQLKQKIIVEHSRCFPDIGEIIVRALKVRLRSNLYHLSDSMLVKSALTGGKSPWFLDAVVSLSRVEPTKDLLSLERCPSTPRDCIGNIFEKENVGRGEHPRIDKGKSKKRTRDFSSDDTLEVTVDSGATVKKRQKTDNASGSKETSKLENDFSLNSVENEQKISGGLSSNLLDSKGKKNGKQKNKSKKLPDAGSPVFSSEGNIRQKKSTEVPGDKHEELGKRLAVKNVREETLSEKKTHCPSLTGPHGAVTSVDVSEIGGKALDSGTDVPKKALVSKEAKKNSKRHDDQHLVGEPNSHIVLSVYEDVDSLVNKNIGSSLMDKTQKPKALPPNEDNGVVSMKATTCENRLDEAEMKLKSGVVSSNPLVSSRISEVRGHKVSKRKKISRKTKTSEAKIQGFPFGVDHTNSAGAVITSKKEPHKAFDGSYIADETKRRDNISSNTEMAEASTFNKGYLGDEYIGTDPPDKTEIGEKPLLRNIDHELVSLEITNSEHKKLGEDDLETNNKEDHSDKTRKKKLQKSEISGTMSHELSSGVNHVESGHAVGSSRLEPGKDNNCFSGETNRESKMSSRDEELQLEVRVSSNPLISPDVIAVVKRSDKKRKKPKKSASKAPLSPPQLKQQAVSNTDPAPSICSGPADKTEIVESTLPHSRDQELVSLEITDSDHKTLGEDDLEMKTKDNIASYEPLDSLYNVESGHAVGSSRLEPDKDNCFGGETNRESKMSSRDEESHLEVGVSSNPLISSDVIAVVKRSDKKRKKPKKSASKAPLSPQLKQQAVSNADPAPSICSGPADKTEIVESTLPHSRDPELVSLEITDSDHKTLGEDDLEMKTKGNVASYEPLDSLGNVESGHAVGSSRLEPGKDNCFGGETNRESKMSSRDEELQLEVRVSSNPLNSPDVIAVVKPTDKKRKNPKKSASKAPLGPRLKQQAVSNADSAPSICSGPADRAEIVENALPHSRDQELVSLEITGSDHKTLGEDDLEMKTKGNAASLEPLDSLYNGDPSDNKRRKKVKKMGTSNAKSHELPSGVNYIKSDGAVTPSRSKPSEDIDIDCFGGETNRESKMLDQGDEMRTKFMVASNPLNSAVNTTVMKPSDKKRKKPKKSASKTSLDLTLKQQVVGNADPTHLTDPADKTEIDEKSLHHNRDQELTSIVISNSEEKTFGKDEFEMKTINNVASSKPEDFSCNGDPSEKTKRSKRRMRPTKMKSSGPKNHESSSDVAYVESDGVVNPPRLEPCIYTNTDHSGVKTNRESKMPGQDEVEVQTEVVVAASNFLESPDSIVVVDLSDKRKKICKKSTAKTSLYPPLKQQVVGNAVRTPSIGTDIIETSASPNKRKKLRLGKESSISGNIGSSQTISDTIESNMEGRPLVNGSMDKAGRIHVHKCDDNNVKFVDYFLPKKDNHDSASLEQDMQKGTQIKDNHDLASLEQDRQKGTQTITSDKELTATKKLENLDLISKDKPRSPNSKLLSSEVLKEKRVDASITSGPVNASPVLSPFKPSASPRRNSIASSVESTQNRVYKSKGDAEVQSQLNCYRVLKRKSSHNKMGKSLDRKKLLLATSSTVFKDSSSESSEDLGDISEGRTRTPSVTSSDSSEGESVMNLDSPGEGTSGRKSGVKNSAESQRDMSLDMFLRSSKSYKKARLTASQSQPEDSES
ncbi:hypothetical protein GIB67_004489 [Kingdonia uniflora]|uniref:Uncharacterized protein n=1 Tax=Kingdonia uniflora TaxID=39325 RepID=A0A7J7MRK7_9MAGN|nr:hypothetical protein GIB67_004489 [Kingdonia uniflora]